MATLTASQFQVVLKELVQPELENLLNKSTTLWNLLANKQPDEINSRGLYFLANKARNPAFTWFQEASLYPAGHYTERIKMSVPFARFAISGRMSRDVLEHSSNVAFIKSFVDFVKEDSETAMAEMNYQLYGDGRGFRASITGVSGTNLTVAPTARFIYLNQEIDIYDSTGTNLRGTATVTNVDVATSTVTVNSVPAGTTSTDVIVASGSIDKSIYGLLYHINNNNTPYQGLPSRIPELRCFVLNAGSSALSLNHLKQVQMLHQYKRGTDMSDKLVIVSSPAQAYQYLTLVGTSNITQFVPNSEFDRKVLDLGFRVIEFAGIKWIIDTFCPDSEIFFVNPEYLNKCELKPLSIVPLGDQGLAPIVGQTPSNTFTYRDEVMYVLTAKLNTYSRDPVKLGARITNLSVPSGVNW